MLRTLSGVRWLIALGALCAVGAASAQQAQAQEEPGWAKGRPKTEDGHEDGAGAGVPDPDRRPTSCRPRSSSCRPASRSRPGPRACSMRAGCARAPKGNIFVSTLFVGNKVYAVPESGKREAKVIIDKMPMATGIEYPQGQRCTSPRTRRSCATTTSRTSSTSSASPRCIYDKLPGGNDHSWKFLRIKNDKLYYRDRRAVQHLRSGRVRQDLPHEPRRRRASRPSPPACATRSASTSIPKTGNLWFTDNGRDWLSEELPNDELNVVTQPGKQHFGYPFCHQGNIPDPEFGWGKSCDDYVKPAALLGPHAGSLGLKFYTGKMFPAKYQGAMFIARHGPWNRTKKYAGVSVAWPDGKGGAKVEPFMTGFVENNTYLGRPVGLPRDEGRLAAGERRPRGSDLPHQLRRQVSG